MKDLVLLGDRDDRLVTHRELAAAIEQLPDHVRPRWVRTDSAEAAWSVEADGLWVIPGSPYADDAAVYGAIERARTSGQPFLGTCGGFQYAVVEFARNVAGMADAAHAETTPDARQLVIGRLRCSLVGEDRLVVPVPGTRFHELTRGRPFVGSHWCNYGLSSSFVEQLSTHGLVVAADAPDAGVEAVELPGDRFYMATLFQPQIGALSGKALHPVIDAFVAAL